MGDKDGTGDRERHAVDREGHAKDREPERPIVDDVVGERSDARTAQVADRREVGK